MVCLIIVCHHRGRQPLWFGKGARGPALWHMEGLRTPFFVHMACMLDPARGMAGGSGKTLKRP
jgi:hypothetical protein